MKTAVEWLVEELSLKSKALKIMLNAHKEIVEQAKAMEQEQKIKMLNTFLCNAQMGEDVEDVEAWFENYEKQQSFFKPVLCEPIWNVTNRTN